MDHDHLFRWILIAGFAGVVPIAFYYRLRAHRQGRDRLDRRQEGWFILLTLRPIAGFCMIGLIAYLIHPPSMAWSALPLPTWLRWIGVLLGALAGALLLWTFHTLGPNLTDTVVTRSRHTLITTGPYRYVRHPFYVSVALALTANALATANAFIAATGLAVFSLLVLRTSKEEANLIARFGDDYRHYMRTTGRFFPRFGRASAESVR